MEPYPYSGDGRKRVIHIVVISMHKAEATGARFNQTRAISVQTRDKVPPECIKCVINIHMNQTTFGSLKKDDTTSLFQRVEPSWTSKESSEKLHARLIASGVHADTEQRKQEALQAKLAADAKEKAEAEAAAIKLEETPARVHTPYGDTSSSEEEPEEGDFEAKVEEVPEEDKGTYFHDPKTSSRV